MINLTLRRSGEELNVHIQPTETFSGFNPYVTIPKGEKSPVKFFNMKGELVHDLVFEFGLDGNTFEVYSVVKSEEPALLFSTWVSDSGPIGNVFGSPKKV